MKYRMLTDDELQHLEEDLKHFLIVNGVHDAEWTALNRDEPEKARELVGVFSDTVLQKVYEKLEFLEFRSADACMVFHCGKDRQEVIALNRKSGSAVDLATPEGVHDALARHAGDLSFFRTGKGYGGTREEEIHRLLEQGCVLSTKVFWDALSAVVAG